MAGGEGARGAIADASAEGDVNLSPSLVTGAAELETALGVLEQAIRTVAGS